MKRAQLHPAQLWRALATLRRALIPGLLERHAQRFTSQNGEDGIIQEIFRRIGTENRFFVEFGVGVRDHVYECNTRHLLELGWRGVWIDCDPNVKTATERGVGTFKPIDVATSFVTAENAVATLRSLAVPEFPDLMSIDLDGNDYWIWQALSTVFRPRVLIVEYNAAFGPWRRWIMPYDPGYVWSGYRDFGASLGAFCAIGKELGYRLVACDPSGTNAFFVRAELAAPFRERFLPTPLLYTAGQYNAPHLGWGRKPVKKPFQLNEAP